MFRRSVIRPPAFISDRSTPPWPNPQWPVLERGLFDNGQAVQRRHTFSLVCGALTVAWAIVLIG